MSDTVHFAENPQSFWTSFQAKLLELKKLLEESGKVATADLPAYFDSTIANTLRTLTDSVANATLFLPSYDVRQARKQTDELQVAIAEKRAQLIPRKKFAFKSPRAAPQASKVVNENTDVHTSAKMAFAVADDPRLQNGIRDASDQTICVARGSATHSDFVVAKTVHSTVIIKDVLSALQLTDLTHCRILCGPVSGPVFVERCSNCVFVFACQQLRVHASQQCDFFLHVVSRAIIEDSDMIRMAKYKFDYQDLDEDFRKSGLDRLSNHWDDVDDFNWIREEHSPHWTVMSEEDQLRRYDSIINKSN